MKKVYPSANQSSSNGLPPEHQLVMTEPALPSHFLAQIWGGSRKGSLVFQGTGFFIAPDLVLTCRHVVKERLGGQETKQFHGRHEVRLETNAQAISSKVLWHSDTYDLAVLQLDGSHPERLVPLVVGVNQSNRASWLSRDWHTIGYPGHEQGTKSERCRLVKRESVPEDGENGYPKRVEVEVGIAHGCSGSPVVFYNSGRWLCTGLLYLGGEGKYLSVAITSDLIYRTLCQELKPENGNSLHAIDFDDIECNKDNKISKVDDSINRGNAPLQIREQDHQVVHTTIGANTTQTCLFEPYQEIERAHLVQDLWTRFDRLHKGLLLLAPREGGARTLVEQMLVSRQISQSALTVLASSDGISTVADYFRDLTHDYTVHSSLQYREWQRRRIGTKPHLVVLLHDGGPLDAVWQLAGILRSLMNELRTFKVLAAGEARAAHLSLGLPGQSIFTNLRKYYVPDLSVEEVRNVMNKMELSENLILAEDVWRATGGHPGFLRQVLTLDSLNEESIVEELQEETLGRLNWRLTEDDREQYPEERHSAWVLRALLDMQPVESLSNVKKVKLELPEVRLYYDGLLRTNEHGNTEFRCEAVKLAAKIALDLWEKTR